MKDYAEYQLTGITWMPRIPSDWSIAKVKYTTYVKGRIGWQGLRSDEFLTEGVHLVTGTDFANGKINWDTCYRISEERYIEDSNIHLEEGDILITKDGTIGKVAIVESKPEKATLNSGIFITRPTSRDYTPQFLYYVLTSNVFWQFIDLTKAGSTIQHLYQNVFNDFQYPLPSKEEQRAIARFLDDKTNQIDQLITQKQQMLVLLQEERAALINHAVTKGLDSAAPVRDSGIEWLGEVPAHWEVKRLKHLLTGLEQGWSPSCENREADLGEWGVLKVGCVNGLHFDASENKALPAELVPMPEYEISEGDFLISRANTKELVGSASIVEGVRPKLMLCDKLFRLYFNESANQEYVLLIIGSSYGRYQIQSECSGASSSMQNISQEFLKNMVVLLPPQEEQRSIVEYVAEHSTRITETANTINQEIVLLQEYRAALIAEAVTGQIDVRSYESVLAEVLM